VHERNQPSCHEFGIGADDMRVVLRIGWMLPCESFAPPDMMRPVW
jgi:hypothetical protein